MADKLTYLKFGSENRTWMRDICHKINEIIERVNASPPKRKSDLDNYQENLDKIMKKHRKDNQDGNLEVLCWDCNSVMQRHPAGTVYTCDNCHHKVQVTAPKTANP